MSLQATIGCCVRAVTGAAARTPRVVAPVAIATMMRLRRSPGVLVEKDSCAPLVLQRSISASKKGTGVHIGVLDDACTEVSDESL